MNKEIDGGSFAISLPKRWGGYDTREVYEKKEGYESHLIFHAVNFGGSPRSYVYEVDNLEFESVYEQYEQLIDWDVSRMISEGEVDKLSISQPADYFSGKLITFVHAANQPLLSSTICKDWVKVIQNSGYIISICEGENRWERLDKIYPDIIQSFTIID